MKAVRWSEEQLKNHRARRLLDEVAKLPTPAPPAMPEPAKRSKYASKTVEVGQMKFDSKKEARRWAELELMQAAGQISELQRQVPFVLAPAVLLAGDARTKPALRYFADATYVRGGQLVVEDTKSTPTRKKEAYRIKRHLMATVLGIHVRET